MMELVLKYTGRWRPIVSVPFAVGILQGTILERLPTNLFTVTRSQVEQLKEDNVVNPILGENFLSFKDILSTHAQTRLESVHDLLPTYLK